MVEFTVVKEKPHDESALIKILTYRLTIMTKEVLLRLKIAGRSASKDHPNVA